MNNPLQWVVAIATVAIIWWLGFGAILWVLGVIVGLYLLAAIAMPFILRAKMRFEEKPAVTSITRDDATVSEAVRAELRRNRDALVALGFQPRDMIHHPPGMSPGVYFELFVHPETGASALSRVLLKPGKAETAGIAATEVEFELRYDDGTSVELSNVATPIPALDRMPGLIRQMPHVRDVPSLWSYFLLLVARYEKGNTRRRRPLGDEATLTEVYHGQLAKGYEVRQAAGLVEPTGVQGHWRPTWRMSLLMAASAVSPTAELMKRRVRLAGEQLQRELDSRG